MLGWRIGRAHTGDWVQRKDEWRGHAFLAKHLRAKVRYSYTAKTATLVMRNVRSDDPHARNTWVIRIMDNLAKYKVRAISAQV